jgi:hypothetical protein
MSAAAAQVQRRLPWSALQTPAKRRMLKGAFHAAATLLAAGGAGVGGAAGEGESEEEGEEEGAALAAAPVYRLVSATGSTAMGRRVSAVVGARLGRSLLELGGNNAMIVAPSARQELALRAALFSAVGTAGQRCTTLRRLLVQETIAEGFVARLAAAYRSLRVGDPREPSTLVGPLQQPHLDGAPRESITQRVVLALKLSLPLPGAVAPHTRGLHARQRRVAPSGHRLKPDTEAPRDLNDCGLALENLQYSVQAVLQAAAAWSPAHRGYGAGMRFSSWPAGVCNWLYSTTIPIPYSLTWPTIGSRSSSTPCASRPVAAR